MSDTNQNNMLPSIINDSFQVRKELASFINSKEICRLISYYKRKSFWEMVHIERKEVAHSHFLAWLLSPNETHELGVFCIKQLFVMISIILDDMKWSIPYSDDKSHQIFDKIILDKVLLGECEFEDISVDTEYPIVDKRRLDIFITGNIKYQNKEENEQLPFKIIIENKVGSDEHGDQTQAYFNWVKSYQDNSPKTQIICLYLLPLSNNEIRNNIKRCICNQFIQINYQYLLQYVLQPSLDHTTNARTKFLLEDYIRALSISPITENDKSNSGDFTMAIGEKEKALLRDFLYKYSSLILVAAEACADDEDETLSSNIATKYVVLEVLKKLKADNNLPNKEDFTRIQNIKTGFGTYTTLLNEKDLNNSNVNDKENRWFMKEEDIILYDNEKYFVTTQWTKEGLETFCSEIQKIYKNDIQINPIE